MSRGHRRVGGGYDGGGDGADGDGQGAAAVAAAVVVQPVGVRLRRGPGGGELHWQSKKNELNLILKHLTGKVSICHQHLPLLKKDIYPMRTHTSPN